MLQAGGEGAKVKHKTQVHNMQLLVITKVNNVQSITNNTFLWIIFICVTKHMVSNTWFVFTPFTNLL